MTYSTHSYFWDAIKEAAHEVASDLMRLNGTLPQEVWNDLPDEYTTVSEDGTRTVAEEDLIEWFDALFDEEEAGAWCDRIANYADLCDMQRREEAEEAKTPTEDTVGVSQE